LNDFFDFIYVFFQRLDFACVQVGLDLFSWTLRGLSHCLIIRLLMMVLQLNIFSYHVKLVYDLAAIVFFGLNRVSYAKMHFQIGMPNVLQDLDL
jgi:hypothetical protein